MNDQFFGHLNFSRVLSYTFSCRGSPIVYPWYRESLGLDTYLSRFYVLCDGTEGTFCYKYIYLLYANIQCCFNICSYHTANMHLDVKWDYFDNIRDFFFVARAFFHLNENCKKAYKKLYTRKGKTWNRKKTHVDRINVKLITIIKLEMRIERLNLSRF